MIFSIEGRYRFRLDPAFLAPYRSREPQWGPLGHLVYLRTYAREIADERSPGGKRLEHFSDTLQRGTEFVFSVLAQQIGRSGQRWDAEEAQTKAQEFFRRAWEGKFMLSGRMLWFLGAPALFEKGGAPLFNCVFVSTNTLHNDFADPFAFMMDFLMCGCGVGFDTRGKGFVPKQPVCDGPVFEVQDSREGWVAALRAVFDAFSGKRALPSSFDVSRVRPKGVPIASFGGTSSGPEPLLWLLEETKRHLLRCVGQPLTAADITDLMNRIGVCVVAGNVRRSSQIALGEATDQDFVKLKDPVLAGDALTSHRWASNNTVFADELDAQTLQSLADQTARNGEPGYFWFDVARTHGRLADGPDERDTHILGLNPCGEVQLEDRELCNVPETFPGRHESLDDYLVTLKYAYLLGKVVSLIPTHNAKTNAVITRNRRLGISMAGVAAMYDRMGMRECIRWWDTSYKYLRALDRSYSRWMGVNESVRLTSIKPGGTVPLLFGEEGGMKWPSAKHYFRTVRLASDHPLVRALADAGHRIEKDKYARSTVVAYFPVRAAEGCRMDEEVPLWEKAALLSALQTYWADNSVSATLTFSQQEAPQIARVVAAFTGKLKTVSFLPRSEHGYEQAPYQQISATEYEQAAAQIRPLRLSEHADVHDTDEKFCSGDVCERPAP